MMKLPILVMSLVFISAMSSGVAQEVVNEYSPDGQPSLIMSVESDYDFKTTIDRVKEAIANNNFRYLKELSYRDANRESRSLFFCNFDMLARGVEQDSRVGVGLPCAIVVTHAGESVKIQTIDPALAAATMGVRSIALCQELRGMLADVLDEAVL
jgi:uncharacterized protein (DUF302 family)